MNGLNFLFINHMIKEFSYEYFISLIFIYKFNIEKYNSKINSVNIAKLFVNTMLRMEGEELLFLDKTTTINLRLLFPNEKNINLPLSDHFFKLIEKVNENQFSLTEEDIYYTYSYIINFSSCNLDSNFSIESFSVLERNITFVQKEIEVCLKNCFFRFVHSNSFLEFTMKMNNYEKNKLKNELLANFSYNKMIAFFKLNKLSQKVG